MSSTNNPGKSARLSSRETDYLHAGQCYAFAGKKYYTLAISHFAKSHKPDRPERNMYVMASICFLRGDVPALEKAVIDMKSLISPTSKNFELVAVAEKLLEFAKKGNFSYLKAYKSV